MRLFFAVLLCLAIPLRGWAAGAGVQAPCPMGDTVAMQAETAGEEMADLGDCCNDAATAALTGKLCKTGQECQAPTGWLTAPSQPAAQAPADERAARDCNTHATARRSRQRLAPPHPLTPLIRTVRRC